MFNVKTFLRQAILALALAGSSLAAMAGPVGYHVNVNTSGRTGTGWLDFMFNGNSVAPITATLRNFSSAFGTVTDEIQVTFNPDGSIALVNMPDFGSYLKFDLNLGGDFGFDVLFSDDQSGDMIEGGSWLSIAVGEADNTFGDPTGIVQFELRPGQGLSVAVLDRDFASLGPIAADLPEPADWLLVATGLALLGASLRRRMPR